MDKILITINPFDLGQTIYIFNGLTELEKFTVKNIEEIPDKILSLSTQYNIHQIYINGFLGEDIIKKIREKEYLKYQKNILEIESII